jgi:phospholipase C
MESAYDNWAVQEGPIAMSYMTRDDLPYHYALADALTVGDAYCSIMGPTNSNRCYLWTGCIGNVNYLGRGALTDSAPGHVSPARSPKMSNSCTAKMPAVPPE